jgi:hypothetical protein
MNGRWHGSWLVTAWIILLVNLGELGKGCRGEMCFFSRLFVEGSAGLSVALHLASGGGAGAFAWRPTVCTEVKDATYD